MNVARDYTHHRLSPERPSITRVFANGRESPQLDCARYRYDERRHNSRITIALIVEELRLGSACKVGYCRN
jgi:hypothetical protein